MYLISSAASLSAPPTGGLNALAVVFTAVFGTSFMKIDDCALFLFQPLAFEYQPYLN